MIISINALLISVWSKLGFSSEICSDKVSIEFSLNKSQKIKAEIFDILGRKIDKIENKNLEKGFNKIVWNAQNYSTGIYYLKISAENKVFTKKLLLAK